MAVDSQGDLFIADSGNAVVEEVTRNGILSVVAGVVGKEGPPTPGPATSSDLDAPDGVAVDARGDLFIADWLNLVVEKVTPAGTLSIVAGDGGQGPPTPGPATSSDIDGPMSVAADASGDLFIADYGNNVVEEVTPAGILSVVAGDGKAGPPTPGPATDSNLNQPGVAADDRGDLFIADYGNNVVEEVDPDGTLSIVAGDGEAGPPVAGLATRSHLNEPSGVAIDSRGNLFIADLGNSVVERVTPAGNLSVVAGVAGQHGPPTTSTSTG